MSARGKHIHGLSMRSRLVTTAKPLYNETQHKSLDSQHSVLESRQTRLKTSDLYLTHPFFFFVQKQTNPTAVVHQGGGLVNAYCAMLANTTISTSSLVLNDTSYFKAHQTFNITNEGEVCLNYTLDHLPATTVYTFGPDSEYGLPQTTPIRDPRGACVKLSHQTFSLSPGESLSLSAYFTPPQIDPSLLAVYSGYITLVSEGIDRISLGRFL